MIRADDKLKMYLACDMGQCFAVDKDLEKVILNIESRQSLLD